ncbi:unnamed protein product [Echinostoma caproni]|uniref:Receptor expression-enhancing protein n=1 Tax=Echinostoma caproni TaxID=27848 RepID=A0A3P8D6K3_9TREM|nr:unnamed protein product [Echinostoma caproni]
MRTIIIFGVLHPSYKTYKAIKKRDYQEVVCPRASHILVFESRLPFYYEAKIAFVIWLVTPATSGYSIIYRKLIHPELSKRETVGLLSAAEHGYTKVVEFGAKGLNYAAKTVLSTALMSSFYLPQVAWNFGDSIISVPSLSDLKTNGNSWYIPNAYLAL